MIRKKNLGNIIEIKYFKIVINIMAKNKGTRILITLECTECRSNNNKRSTGVSRYHSQKNRRNNPARFELKKYCPYCNKPTIHKEIK